MQKRGKIIILALLFFLFLGGVLSVTITHFSLRNSKEPQQSITIKQKFSPIRKGPSTQTAIVKIAKAGETYTVQTELQHWYKIKINGTAGYIMRPSPEINPSRKASNLSNKIIVIDPGHGGSDNGATGVSGVKEKDVTLKTAKQLADNLEQLGAKTAMTRKNDTYVSLTDRANLAKKVDADGFISLHFNSTTEAPDTTGINTFYFAEQDKIMASKLQKQVIHTTHARNRKTGLGDFQVLRENSVPAVLIELGFLSNKDEEKQLRQGDYQQELTEGITKGLANYFANQN